jgi:hypothetical protein
MPGTTLVVVLVANALSGGNPRATRLISLTWRDRVLQARQFRVQFGSDYKKALALQRVWQN